MTTDTSYIDTFDSGPLRHCCGAYQDDQWSPSESPSHSWPFLGKINFFSYIQLNWLEKYLWLKNGDQAVLELFQAKWSKTWRMSSLLDPSKAERTVVLTRWRISKCFRAKWGKLTEIPYFRKNCVLRERWFLMSICWARHSRPERSQQRGCVWRFFERPWTWKKLDPNDFRSFSAE